MCSRSQHLTWLLLSVVSWSDVDYSKAVQGQLKPVQQIQATRFAFAAILDDGSVLTWVVTVVWCRINCATCGGRVLLLLF